MTNLLLILSSVSHSIASLHGVKLQLRGGRTRAEKKLGKKTKMRKIYYTIWDERKNLPNLFLVYCEVQEGKMQGTVGVPWTHYLFLN